LANVVEVGLLGSSGPSWLGIFEFGLVWLHRLGCLGAVGLILLVLVCLGCSGLEVQACFGLERSGLCSGWVRFGFVLVSSLDNLVDFTYWKVDKGCH
jgi:hypothetical protein